MLHHCVPVRSSRPCIPLSYVLSFCNLARAVGSNHLYFGDDEDLASWTFLDYFHARGDFLPPLFCHYADYVSVPLKIVLTLRDQYIQNYLGFEMGSSSIVFLSKFSLPLECDNTHIIYRGKAVAEEDEIVPSGLMR